MTALTPTTPMRRYEIEPTTGCWLWRGAITTDGYAQLKIDGKVLYAHRVSYQLHKGGISRHREIDHVCRTRHCVNPDHLELVTRAENARRGARASITPAMAATLRAEPESITHRGLARKYGISVQVVSSVRRGLSWR